MGNDITKNSASDSIDVNSLRAEVKNDPRFFKDRAFTRSGKERLAAIQEIEDVQSKDLKYKIYDNNTFDIVDKSGKVVETESGKGVETGKKIGMLYGMLNKEKRSKKEVSTILGGINKPVVKTVAEQAKEKITEPIIEKKAETAKTEPVAVVETKAPVKIGSDEPFKEAVIEPKKELTATEKREAKVVEGKVKKVPAKVNGDKPTNAIPETKPVVYSLNANETKDEVLLKKSLIDSDVNSDEDKIKSFEVNKKFKSGVQVLNNHLNKDYAISSYIQEQVDAINTLKDQADRASKLNVLTRQSKEAIKPELIAEHSAKVQDKTLEEFKNYRQSVYGEKITKLKSILQGIKDNSNYSPEFKANYQGQYDAYIKSLEAKRNEFNNKDKNALKEELLSQFGERTGVYKNGGIIPKFQLGGYFNGSGQWVDENGKIDFTRTKKSEDPFSNMSANESDLQDAGKKLVNGIWMTDEQIGAMQDEQVKNYTANANKSATADYKGSQQTFPSKPEKMGSDDITTQGKTNEEKAAKRKAISDNLKNFHNPIQLNDLIQGALLYKSWKTPVTTVKAPQDIFRPGYVSGVRDERGLDAGSMATMKNKVLNTRSGYDGSDPIMSTIFRQTNNIEKTNGLNEINILDANERIRTRDVKWNDIQANQAGHNANIQGEVATINLNNREQQHADLLNAQELARRKSEMLKGISDISANIQTRWNNQRATDQQFKAGLEAKDIAAKQESASNKLSSAKEEYKTLMNEVRYNPNHTVTKEDLETAKNNINTANTEYESVMGSSKQEITTAKSNIDRSGSILDLFRK